MRNGEKVESFGNSMAPESLKKCEKCRTFSTDQDSTTLNYPQLFKIDDESVKDSHNRGTFKGTSTKRSYDKCDLRQFKRSLELLGLAKTEKVPDLRERKPEFNGNYAVSSALSTRILTRSVSLDFLREEMNKYEKENCRMGTSFRKLLSQAVYEEWYFKAMREFRIKKELNKQKREENRQKLEKEFEGKKIRGQEEFRKWLNKKASEKIQIAKTKKQASTTSQVVKKKRDTSTAFRLWKKSKDEALRKKKEEELKEEENKIRLEKEKLERKKVAEKVFQQWKKNTEKRGNHERKKIQEKVKKNQTLQLDINKEHERNMSFLAWKVKKEKEINRKLNSVRKLTLLTDEKRVKFMEERMHEAQRAFEIWLDDTYCRKKSNDNPYKHVKPWIPV